MKRRRQAAILIPAFLLSLVIGQLSAAVPSRVALPVVSRPLAAPDVTTVLECSCGFASVYVAPDGTILVTVQDFARGGRLFVYADLGGAELVPVAAPPLVGQGAEPGPSFAFPAQKNGPGGAIIKDGVLSVYAPARPVGETTGPYNLLRYRQPYVKP